MIAETYQLSHGAEISPSSTPTSSPFASRKAILPVNLVVPLSTRRRVRFCEENNKIYASPHGAEMDVGELWYNAVDYHSFKKLNIKYARFLLSREKWESHTTWFDVLRKEYQQCCNATTNEDLASLCEASIGKRRFLPGYVGMNAWMIAAVYKDRQRRRARMYDRVYRLQNCGQLDDSTRAERIGFACREISRPCRLFAFHTARLHFMSRS